MDGRTTAMGSPAPRVASSDSAKLFVNVYVLGQPSSFARRVPAAVICWRTQRVLFLRSTGPYELLLQIDFEEGCLSKRFFFSRLDLKKLRLGAFLRPVSREKNESLNGNTTKRQHQRRDA